ncbi:hypothetical protein BDZ45DRAFT_384027 [Acephala macrosclerotiorum]|nr:hypothetical protein BDZ45DRAFT_384027 [Acephala macrosclerotiorum]
MLFSYILGLEIFFQLYCLILGFAALANCFTFRTWNVFIKRKMFHTLQDVHDSIHISLKVLSSHANVKLSKTRREKKKKTDIQKGSNAVEGGEEDFDLAVPSAYVGTAFAETRRSDIRTLYKCYAS